MENVNNFIGIQSNSKLDMSPEGDFFRIWVEFLKPVHKLAKREMDILAAFLKERYRLGKAIIDQNTLDSVLMSWEVKKKIREECGMKPKHFLLILGRFKKNGVLVNGKIDLNLIPSMTEEGVGLLIYFNFKNEQHIRLGIQEDGKVL